MSIPYVSQRPRVLRRQLARAERRFEHPRAGELGKRMAEALLPDGQDAEAKRV